MMNSPIGVYSLRLKRRARRLPCICWWTTLTRRTSARWPRDAQWSWSWPTNSGETATPSWKTRSDTAGPWGHRSARTSWEATRCLKQALRRAKRISDTGGLAKKDRITHRIEITVSEQIDAEVRKWLKTAYDLNQ